MAVMGRPTELKPAVKRKFVKALRDGNYIETAAAMAGISTKTVYNWMRRGSREENRLEENPRARPKKEEAPFLDFLQAVTRAQAEAEAAAVQAIIQAEAEDWRAAAWRLERKFPDRWGRKDRLAAELEHSGEVGMKVVVDYGDDDE